MSMVLLDQFGFMHWDRLDLDLARALKAHDGLGKISVSQCI